MCDANIILSAVGAAVAFRDPGPGLDVFPVTFVEYAILDLAVFQGYDPPADDTKVRADDDAPILREQAVVAAVDGEYIPVADYERIIGYLSRRGHSQITTGIRSIVTQ